MLTDRDRQYLKIIFRLGGKSEPVGPVALANELGVTKVCAHQKMHRLEAMGYGRYIRRKGLQLTEAGTNVVEEEIKRHHILEKFLEKNLDMSHEQACDHSDHIASSVCAELLRAITTNIQDDLDCDCGHCLHECGEHSGLENCHWLRK